MLSLAPDDVLDGDDVARGRVVRNAVPLRSAARPRRRRPRARQARPLGGGARRLRHRQGLGVRDGRRAARAPTFARGCSRRASACTEDPATGSACVALGGYLAARDPRSDGTLRWVVEQGFEMGRPSILEVEADKRAGKVTAARVGGKTVLVCEGTMTI